MKKANNMEERIGFKINDNKLELVLPIFIKEKYPDESYSIDEKIKYFKLLRKYKKHSTGVKEETLNNFKNLKEEEYIYSAFEAYYLLLEDYMKYGVFIFSEKSTNQKQKGRINWNKTINRSNLIISDDSLIYSSPYHMNNNIIYNHPLTILYGIHLLEIEKHTELKINLNHQYEKIIEDKRRTISPKEIFDNYKSSMFSDRHRKVFKILEIINRKSRALSKTKSNKELYYLNIEENAEVKTGSRMIPDIIKEYKDRLYIIDAKNYLPHIKNNLPASSDINKQVLYRYFLSKEFSKTNKYDLKNIKNIFLLPSDLQGATIKKIGIHKFSNIENEMGDIHLYQIDFNSVVNSYINKKREIKEIILEILSLEDENI